MILYVTSRRLCCMLYRRKNVHGCACVCVCSARKTTCVFCKKSLKKTWTTSGLQVKFIECLKVNKYLLLLLEVSPHVITYIMIFFIE